MKLDGVINASQDGRQKQSHHRPHVRADAGADRGAPRAARVGTDDNDPVLRSRRIGPSRKTSRAAET